MSHRTSPPSPQASTPFPPRRRVAILLFDDVEVLDFAGPFEVFGVARDAAGQLAFDVFAVALDTGEIVARNGLRVTPDCAAADMGAIDIFVAPGGLGTRREMTNPAMLDVLRSVCAEAEVVFSVCTGALLLGAAGVLRGLSATTHFAAIPELEALACCAEVLPGARVVDNGAVVTSAGVSAGIDGALYIVGRMIGVDRAAETARYMQYDWRHQTIDGQHVVRTA